MAGLDIASNVEISHREAETGLPLMNWNHALFSFGFALAAGLAGLARRFGAEPGAIMAVIGIAVMIAAFATRERAASVRPITDKAIPLSLPWRIVVPAGAILFFAFVAENGTESWSALHLERNFHAATGTGAFGPMMLGLTMGLGRVSGQVVAARLGEARLVALSAVIAALGAGVTALAPVQGIAVAGIALIGIGAAVVVPSANSLLGQKVARDMRVLALSRAWLIGFTGFFIGPVVMGLIAQGVGLRWAFAAIALMLAAILPALARLMRTP
jgi:hypothetical protein